MKCLAVYIQETPGQVVHRPAILDTPDFPGLVVSDFYNIFTFSVSRTYKATPPPAVFLS